MIRKLIGKLQCLTGYHNWTASMQDYIDEWGYVPFDNRIAKNSKCARCKTPYNKETNKQI